MTLRFKSYALSSEAPSPTDLPDLLVRTTAEFELSIDDEPLYEEPDFPVVELAAALVGWLRSPPATRPDFEFDSMSTPEPGWVWIRRATDGWTVGSLHQSRPSFTVCSDEEVDAAIEAFVGELVSSACYQLGVDLKWLVRGLER